MLTNIEKNQIRVLITSPGWPLIEKLAQDLANKISYEPKLKDSQWLTARTVVFDEGQKHGIKRFLQEILSTQL